MKDAKTLIIDALNEASEIVPSGKNSLLAIAARAIAPEVSLNKSGISQALGMHPSLMMSIMVTADMAGDTNSRRELGLTLMEKIHLHATPPRLTSMGRLSMATWCICRLEGLPSLLGDLVVKLIPLAQGVISGNEADPLTLKELQLNAEELQRVKVVPLQKGAKSKMGISDEEACRRRASQAVRALVEGLKDGGQNPHLCSTVAGEVAGALCTGVDIPAALDFCIGLDAFMESLDMEMTTHQPGNGGR